jgi:hypothetical protein
MLCNISQFLFSLHHRLCFSVFLMWDNAETVISQEPSCCCSRLMKNDESKNHHEQPRAPCKPTKGWLGAPLRHPSRCYHAQMQTEHCPSSTTNRPITLLKQTHANTYLPVTGLTDWFIHTTDFIRILGRLLNGLPWKVAQQRSFTTQMLLDMTGTCS